MFVESEALFVVVLPRRGCVSHFVIPTYVLICSIDLHNPTTCSDTHQKNWPIKTCSGKEHPEPETATWRVLASGCVVSSTHVRGPRIPSQHIRPLFLFPPEQLERLTRRHKPTCPSESPHPALSYRPDHRRSQEPCVQAITFFKELPRPLCSLVTHPKPTSGPARHWRSCQSSAGHLSSCDLAMCGCVVLSPLSQLRSSGHSSGSGNHVLHLPQSSATAVRS